MRMPTFIITFISIFTAAANADYFKCSIEQMDSVLATHEAEYRILNTSVSIEGFLCEGQINASGETQVQLTDLIGNRVSTASEKGSKASTYLSTVPRHNEYDMICSCGME